MESGESVVEPTPHADVLGTATGEQEHNARRGIGGSFGDDALAIAGSQQLDGLRVRSRDDHSAPLVRPTTGGESERDIGEVDVRMTFEMIGKVVRRGSTAASLRADSTSGCTGDAGSVGAGAGASSTITWAFVPPTPSDEIPARRAESLVHGSPCPESTNGLLSTSMSGLGAVKLASGGLYRCRIACTTLIRLATPAPVSR